MVRFLSIVFYQLQIVYYFYTNDMRSEVHGNKCELCYPSDFV